MPDTITTTALISAFVALIAALISGGIALFNGRKTNENSLAIQNLKGVIDEDLEKLKAKLSHGQIVSSTQWNAEFNSYQAIWKGMVAARNLTQRAVLRENEWMELGLGEYLTLTRKIEFRQRLLTQFSERLNELHSAIHDNAPFYPASIRAVANDMHQAAKRLLYMQLKGLTQLTKGDDIFDDAQFITDTKPFVITIVQGVDQVESLIRARLEAVEVVNRT